MLIFLIVCAIIIVAYISINNLKKAHTIRENAIISSYKERYNIALTTDDEEVEIESNDIILENKLTQQKALELDGTARSLCVTDTLRNSMEHNTLSPQGYKKLLVVAKRLNVSLDKDTQSAEYIRKLRQYWDIENLELSPKDVDISLQKGEICYFHNHVRWHEQRTVTKTVSYSGFSTSFKIAKGVRYRVGSYEPERITTTSLQEIDNGRLFVTSKRLIFMGGKKNTNIKFANILSLVPYSDGVGIEKDSGKSPVLICQDADILVRILSKLNAS